MDVLTQKEIDQAKEQLTKEAFIAWIIAIHTGRPLPLWLCTSNESREQALANVDAQYAHWVKEELEMFERREASDPLRPQLVVGKYT